jgi:hypothetical protein
MLRDCLKLIGLLALSLPLLATTLYQDFGSLEIPWWGWLVAISCLLLPTFALILFLDWSDAARRTDGDNE